MLLHNQRVEGYIRREGRSSLECGQLYDAHRLHHHTTALLDQLDCCVEGATGREEVVDDHDPHALSDAALLDVDGVFAVLLAVRDGGDLAGELAGLAEGDEGDLESDGEGDPKVVPAGLQSGDGVDLVLCAAVTLDKDVCDLGKGCGVVHDGVDVDETDALLGEVVKVTEDLTCFLKFAHGSKCNLFVEKEKEKENEIERKCLLFLCFLLSFLI